MYIKPFAVEEWMNEYEVGARFNIAETCVDSVSLDELFALTGEDKARFLADFSARRLTYGDIVGSDDLRGGICGLYKTVHPEEIVPTHGARRARTTTCSARSSPRVTAWSASCPPTSSSTPSPRPSARTSPSCT